MVLDLRACVVRILKPDGTTAGTGFVVAADGLIATCAHVVEAAGARPGQPIRIHFHLDDTKHTAQVLPQPWSPPEGEDIALLRLERLPTGARPLPLGPAAGSGGHEYLALGYPTGGIVQARWVQGKIGGPVPVVGRKHDLLQLQGGEVDPGLSGAPVLDRKAGWAVGMITGYQDVAHRPLSAPRVRLAYATPAEALHDLWPERIALLPPEPGGEPAGGRAIFAREVRQGVLITGDHNVVYQIIVRHYPALEDYAYDFTNTIETVTRRFVGRDFVFDWLDGFIRRHPCGYLRLIADAGLGKTAIAAEVAKRRRAPVHFVDALMDIARPDQCLNHLCVRLIARYGLPHDHLPLRAGEDSAFLLRLLKEATGRAEGRPVLLVIDGLDEADPVPPGRNWLLLPDRLPEGAYILLTYRPGDYPLHTDAATPVESLTIAWYDPSQQADIEAHLRRQAERPEIRRALEGAEPPIPVERFVAALKEASEGNFMYLSYVLEDIAGREPGFDPLDLERLPRGLTRYYETFWERMAPPTDAPDEEWERWEERHLPVLAGLGVAGEPVMAAWLAAHGGGPERRVRRTLARWQRFLRREQRAGRKTWRIVHRSFADFLAEKVDLGAAHRRVADYYLADPARWQEHGGYAFRHLSGHLAAAGEYDELGRLIERRDWYAAQREYDPARLAYARDVERGLRMAEGRGLGELPAVVGWSLLYGTLRTLATQVPVEALEVLVRLGEEGRALRYAELIIEPEQRAKAYWRIGLALWEREGGRAGERARVVLEWALKAAEGIEETWLRADAFSSIARALAQVGELDWALAVARGIERRRPYAKALFSIAGALAQAGEFDRALTVARGIERERLRAEAFSSIAGALAQVGDKKRAWEAWNKALAVAEGIRNADSRAGALSFITRVLAEVKEFDQALAAAERIERERPRAEALSSIADVLAQTEAKEQTLWDRALAVAKEIRWEFPRAEALSFIAKALAQAGKRDLARRALDQALAAEEEIRWELLRAEALSSIAKALAEVREKERAREVLDQALAAAEGIEDAYWRAEALSSITEALAQAREKEQVLWDRALAAAEGIKNMDDRARALSSIAEALTQVGKFYLALATVEEVENMSERAYTLSSIAGALAQMGERERALEMLNRALAAEEEIEDASERVHAFSSIALALVNIGEDKLAFEAWNRALSVAERIGNAYQRSEALSSIAKALAQARKFNRALTAAKRIGDAEERAGTLSFIAQAMTQAGKLDQALVVAERIEAAYRRAEALSSIARALAQAGKLDRALVAAEGIENTYRRAEALSSIARALAQAGEEERALKVGNQALAAVGWIRNAEKRAEALSSIVGALAQTEVKEQMLWMLWIWNRALAVAREIRWELPRVEALSSIARALAQAGERELAHRALNQAREAAKRIRDVAYSIYGLCCRL